MMRSENLLRYTFNECKTITTRLVFRQFELQNYDDSGIRSGKILFYFDTIFGVCFEIWSQSCGGSLGPSISVRRIIPGVPEWWSHCILNA